MSKSQIFEGVHTAIVTPFKDGELCWDDLARLIEYQIEGGISGIVAVGTTGESPTLSTREHLDVIARTIEFAKGRVPVIAGTGSNSTAEAVALTREAAAAGADAILQVAPYYNKPNQEGLFLHFSAVAEATDKPILLYSIPSRCGIEIGVETVWRLHEKYPHVCGIKEAGGSCDRVNQLVRCLGTSDFAIVSGDDSLTLPFLGLGACGVVSVASNYVVADLVSMVNAARQGDLTTASALHRQYARLFENLFIEPNPVPVKYVLHRAGLLASPEVRLPLAPLSSMSRRVLDESLKSLEACQA